jgi:hypothetical protein
MVPKDETLYTTSCPFYVEYRKAESLNAPLWLPSTFTGKSTLENSVALFLQMQSEVGTPPTPLSSPQSFINLYPTFTSQAQHMNYNSRAGFLAWLLIP